VYLKIEHEGLSQGFQKSDPKQNRHIDKQTDRRDRTHYSAAFAGDKTALMPLSLTHLVQPHTAATITWDAESASLSTKYIMTGYHEI